MNIIDLDANKKPNVLFLADPHSAHDIKWMTGVSKKVNVFIIRRRMHKRNDCFQIGTDVGELNDFSILRVHLLVSSLITLSKIIKRNEIQILHILYAEPNALWSFIKLFKKVKVIITCRGTDILKAIPHYFNKWYKWYIKVLYQSAFKLSDHVTGTSQLQLSNIKRFFPNAQVSLIRTGIDFSKINDFDDHDLPIELHNRKYVFFPRNMLPVYNHEFALESIELLDLRLKENYSFVFIDNDSKNVDYVNFIKAKMEQSTVNCIFLPRLDQKQLYATFKYSSLVVMTPHSDGSPVTAMEAMALNKPLILGPLDYDNDLFKHACKLTSWNRLELASLLAEILKKNDYPKGDHYATVKQNANWEVEMNKLVDIYYKILSIL